MYIEFLIPGEARGKGRPRFTKSGHCFTDEKTASYEEFAASIAKAAMNGNQPLDCPVRMDVRIYTLPPVSWPRKKQKDAIDGFILPTVKPDIDNVLKILCDAFNDVVFKDDKQVTDVYIGKRYDYSPRVLVSVQSMLE